MDEQFNTLYRERALIVAVLCRMLDGWGYRGGTWRDPRDGWLVVGIQVDDTRQWSWHIALAEEEWFAQYEPWEWDGTLTEDKFQSMADWLSGAGR